MSRKSFEMAEIKVRLIGEYDGGILRADVLIGGCLELRSVSLVHNGVHDVLTFPYVNKREAVAAEWPIKDRIIAEILKAKAAGRPRIR